MRMPCKHYGFSIWRSPHISGWCLTSGRYHQLIWWNNHIRSKHLHFYLKIAQMRQKSPWFQMVMLSAARDRRKCIGQRGSVWNSRHTCHSPHRGSPNFFVIPAKAGIHFL
jgi:hypothetical protein